MSVEPFLIGWAACAVILVAYDRVAWWITGRSDFWDSTDRGDAFCFGALTLFAAPMILIVATGLGLRAVWRGMIPIVGRPWSLGRAIQYPENWSRLARPLLAADFRRRRATRPAPSGGTPGGARSDGPRSPSNKPPVARTDR